MILTSRDPESWYESARNTIYTASPSLLQKLKIMTMLPFNARLRRVLPVFGLVDHLWDEIFEDNFEDRDFAIQWFVDREKKVVDTIPSGDLLVFRVGDGWAPLCTFLDVPVPNIPFPRANDRSKFHRNLKLVRSGKVPPID